MAFIYEKLFEVMFLELFDTYAPIGGNPRNDFDKKIFEECCEDFLNSSERYGFRESQVVLLLVAA